MELNQAFTFKKNASDRIAAMRKRPKTGVFLGVLLLVGLLVIVYHFPAVRQRLDWRLDFAMAYARGVFDPIDAPPTPANAPQITSVFLPTSSPTATASLQQTSTPTVIASPTPTPTATPLPVSISLPAPKWERQDINNCGPASLAMYLRFYGWEGDQHDIASLLKPYREDRNVNVEELDYFVRTRVGWLNVQYRVGGDLALLKQFLAAGIPVMIEESFYFEEPFWPNDDLWAAHYFLLTGYDEQAQKFIGQDSFYGANREIEYASLDEYWKSFNRVYILIYLPHQEATVKSILGAHWDMAYNRQHALEVAQQEVQENPQDAFAWFNLGTNLVFFERYIEATDAYDRARAIGLPQRMFRYQFGPFIAYFHAGLMDEVLALTEYALKITPTSEEAMLWRGWAFYRKGNLAEALSYFHQALEMNPNYIDAQYALDFVESQG